jgi:uncharacterized membrane protein YtjA (UPF0391 family)
MFRLAVLFLICALIAGALGIFGLGVSGITWIIATAFLVLTVLFLFLLFTGLGGKTPMD